jgi:hypothetical protein
MQAEPAYTVSDRFGKGWFLRKDPASGLGPKDLTVQHMRSSGDRLIVASDVSPKAGIKMYRTFATPAALAAHLALFKTAGIDPVLYEGLSSETPSRIYNNLDNEVLKRDDEAFAVRVRHFELVRDAFLTSVLLIPAEEIAFQSCRANGAKAKTYKYSTHKVIQGFFLRDHRARLLFKQAFERFQLHLPDELSHCAIFLQGRKRLDPKTGGVKPFWDPKPYASFECLRTLYSSKMGSLRPLLPEEGSSVHLEDHLIGIYEEGALRSMREIDTRLLEGYMRGSTPSGAPTSAPPRAADVSRPPNSLLKARS